MAPDAGISFPAISSPPRRGSASSRPVPVFSLSRSVSSPPSPASSCSPSCFPVVRLRSSSSLPPTPALPRSTPAPSSKVDSKFNTMAFCQSPRVRYVVAQFAQCLGLFVVTSVVGLLTVRVVAYCTAEVNRELTEMQVATSMRQVTGSVLQSLTSLVLGEDVLPTFASVVPALGNGRSLALVAVGGLPMIARMIWH